MKFDYSHEIAKFLLTKELVETIAELSEYFKKQKEYTSDIEIASKFSSFARKKKLSFKKMKVSHGASAKVFVFNNKSIVKIGGTSRLTYQVTFPKKSIPTVVLYQVNKLNYGLLIRIQPKAIIDTSSRWQAYNDLEELSTEEVGMDIHTGNVGIYKNKSVVFDW